MRKESVHGPLRGHRGGYTRDVQDTKRPGLVQRGWRRALDGDRRWGSLDIRPDRFGVTRYRLVVFPPGISEAERRRVRVARGWPLWGAMVWVFCETLFSQAMGPWTALVASTAIYLGLGVVATAKAGDARTQVRTIGAMVMAGYNDPMASARRNQVETFAGALMEADDLLACHEISATAHEMRWWRVYDLMAQHSAEPDRR